MDFVKSWEKFRPNLYNDLADNCTIGYGELVHYGRCTYVNEPAEYLAGITEARATQILHDRFALEFVPAVRSAVAVPMRQHQFDAIVSFVYNIGVPKFLRGGPGGTPSGVLKALRARRFVDVPGEIMKWVNAKQKGKMKRSRGLVRRRTAEAVMFRTGAYHNN